VNAQITETVTSLPVSVTALGLLMYLLRRWAKQQDDASMASSEATAREQKRCDERITALEARHVREIAELARRHAEDISSLAREAHRLRRALARILPTLEDPEVRQKVMDELWDGEASKEPEPDPGEGLTP
jgi:hypothetical protein